MVTALMETFDVKDIIGGKTGSGEAVSPKTAAERFT